MEEILADLVQQVKLLRKEVKQLRASEEVASRKARNDDDVWMPVFMFRRERVLTAGVMKSRFLLFPELRKYREIDKGGKKVRQSLVNVTRHDLLYPSSTPALLHK